MAARYAIAVDARDYDTLVGLFVADVQVGRDAAGHEALRASFVDQLARLGPTFLFVGNHVIDLDPGDDGLATGVVYCRAEIDDPDEGWIRQAIVYRDAYRREESHWRFVRRRHELFYGQRDDRRPRDQEPAEWPQRQVGRGTLPESWPTWPDAD